MAWLNEAFGGKFPIAWSLGIIAAFLAASIGLSPVSYTHLRAHETVLDLVCRLLLEKKKHE